jgi:hypothetical protein
MPTISPLRLAFRQEGEHWCAYLANPKDMQDALLLASIRLSIVTHSERHKTAFMELVKAILNDHLKGLHGIGVEDWREQPAPEHERSRE